MIYSVGDCFPMWANNDVLVRIHYRDSFWELGVGYPNITDKEVHEFQFGDMQMTFSSVNHLLFLFFSFGKIPWMDTPYEPRLTSAPMEYGSFEAGEGAPLMVFIVDSKNGEIKAMRSMGLGNVLSNLLHSCCAEMDKHRPLDEEKYRYWVGKTYRQYPSTEKLMRAAKPVGIYMLLNSDKQADGV